MDMCQHQFPGFNSKNWYPASRSSKLLNRLPIQIEAGQLAGETAFFSRGPFSSYFPRYTGLIDKLSTGYQQVMNTDGIL